MRIRRDDSEGTASESIPFPGASSAPTPAPRTPNPFVLTGVPVSVAPVHAAIDHMSRRIEDLARELNCLGYFDDGDDDRPRAA